MQRQQHGRPAGIVGNRAVMAAVGQAVGHRPLGRSARQAASQRRCQIAAASAAGSKLLASAFMATSHSGTR